MSTVEILRRAKALIDTPEKWWQGWNRGGGDACMSVAVSRTICGRGVDQALGAWIKHPAYQALLRATGCRDNREVHAWNDSHSHAEVMAAFNRAIDIAEAVEQEHADPTCPTCALYGDALGLDPVDCPDRVEA